YTLSANVENLTLTQDGGATNGIGNALANTITGNDYDNALNGGTGADILVGGAGSDTYTVDNAADQIIEAIGGGSDTVFASTNFVLTSGSEIEFLRANAGGTGLKLTGNEFDN